MSIAHNADQATALPSGYRQTPLLAVVWGVLSGVTADRNRPSPFDWPDDVYLRAYLSERPAALH
jgi:hypothetical protein